MRAKEHNHIRKMKSGARFRMLSISALGLFAALAAPSAWAQSCVLCYTSVAGGGPQVIRAFEWGVLTLLIPVLLLFAGIFFMIYRRSRAANEEQGVPVVRPAVQPAFRPSFNKAPAAMPIRGSLPTTAS